MRAADQFHVGVVVDELEATQAELTELFGYEWCAPIAVSTPVSLPSGDVVIDLQFAYSMTTPRLEIIQSIPETLWTPAPGSGIHHVGYWSDDVATDSTLLAGRGYATEATGTRPDGPLSWAYHRSPTGPRIEIVSRQLQPALEQYWAAGST